VTDAFAGVDGDGGGFLALVKSNLPFKATNPIQKVHKN
jgi:hypothetical protein